MKKAGGREASRLFAVIAASLAPPSIHGTLP